MTDDQPPTGLGLRSEITAAGEFRLSLVRVDVPLPTPDEITVRIVATPINRPISGCCSDPPNSRR